MTMCERIKRIRQLLLQQTDQTIFFTADLHFGHTNIIRYCSRPFEDIQEMDTVLVARWNATVPEHAVVFILGDVMLGNKENGVKYFSHLSGHKILIAGNHDHKGRLQALAPYCHTVFTIQESPILIPGMRILGRQVVLSHFPTVTGLQAYDDRVNLHRFAPEIDPNTEILLHGHVHTAFRWRPGMMNVGADMSAYAPVDLDYIRQYFGSQQALGLEHTLA